MKTKPLRSPADCITAWLAERDRVRASRTKLGMVGYAHLAAMLRDKPMTISSLQAAARLGHMATYRFVMSLHTLKRAHITGWVQKAHSPLLPLFAFGPGQDAPAPTMRSNGRPVEAVNFPAQQLLPSLIAFEQLLRAIEVPASRQDVIAATGLHYDTVTAALEAMVDLQLAHVPLWLWTPQGGPCLPQYELGPGENMPQPRYRWGERRALLRERKELQQSFQPLLRAMTKQIPGAT